MRRKYPRGSVRMLESGSNSTTKGKALACHCKPGEVKFLSFPQTPCGLKQKMLLQTAHQVTKKSDFAHMKSISSGTAYQARSLMIGSGQKRMRSNSLSTKTPARKKSRNKRRTT